MRWQIFSEKPATGPDGMRATNFITLAGGMLQAVMFGYGGIRVRERQMDVRPHVLPNATSWSIDGFKYRGSTLSFDFRHGDVVVTLTGRNPSAEPLVLLTGSGGGERYELIPDNPLMVERGPFTIVTQSDESFVEQQ